MEPDKATLLAALVTQADKAARATAIAHTAAAHLYDRARANQLPLMAVADVTNQSRVLSAAAAEIERLAHELMVIRDASQT